jgi:hypothetical protein
MQRLLAVVVEGALAIDELLPVLVVVFVERREVGLEGRGIGRFDDGRGGAEVVEAPKSERVVHAQAWRVAFARFHDAA